MPVIEKQDICIRIAEKMKESMLLHSPFEKAFNWNPTTLGNGYPSFICLYCEMDHFFPNPLWEELSHHCMEKLVEAIRKDGIQDTSLFSGLTGICYSISMLVEKTGSYSTLLGNLHSLLLKEIRRCYLEPFHEAKQQGTGFPPRLYDLISGISGIVPYLVSQKNREGTLQVLSEMLEALVQLTQPLHFEGKKVPGWFIPAEFTNEGEPFTKGCLDTGLAHGIAGCLSSLANALLRGIVVEGHREAMQSIALWLQKVQCTIGSFQKVWLPRFSIEYESSEHLKRDITSWREGWCYGVPGTGFALFIAAHALKDQSLYEYAVESMLHACERIKKMDPFICASFCHGYAGALTIMYQMYLATGLIPFLETSNFLFSKIEKRYDESLPFGFKSLVPVSSTEEKEVDSASILQGSVGIILSLLFKRSEKSRPWLQLFLLG